MRPYISTRSLIADDADAYCQAQTPGAAGSLVMNGAQVSGGIGYSNGVTGNGQQRKVLITCAGNEVGKTLTITGRDETGLPLTEDVAGVSGTTTSSVMDFAEIDDVSIDAAGAGDIEVGTSTVGASPPVVFDQYITPFSVEGVFEAAGTINYTLQYSGDDMFNDSPPFNWVAHATVATKTADAQGSIDVPVGAARVVINSGTGSVKAGIRQAGTH